MEAATLDILIELAKAKCDAAQGRHAAVQRSAEQAQAYLATLQQYAREYDERARSQTGEDFDISAQRNEAAFLARLQLAVEAQQSEVERRAGAVMVAAREVAHCLQRRKSLETLAQRRIDAMRRREARRDQRTTDEFGQRARARATAAGLQFDAPLEGSDT